MPVIFCINLVTFAMNVTALKAPKHENEFDIC